MCRLLLVKAEKEVNIAEELHRFAYVARHSKEFQGHGWGCSLWKDDGWHHYKNIQPIWQDDLDRFGESRLFVAHACSAFRDEGIAVENNMPFHDDRHVFIFNGELRGVRISEQGRIGAEKIFNFIKRFDRGSILEALARGTDVIRKRSKYVRAMNIIIADSSRAYVASFFNEDPEYFTLHHSNDGHKTIIVSAPLAGPQQWTPIANGAVREVQ